MQYKDCLNMDTRTTSFLYKPLKQFNLDLNRCKGVDILFSNNHHSSQVLVYFKIYLFLSIYTSI